MQNPLHVFKALSQLVDAIPVPKIKSLDRKGFLEKREGEVSRIVETFIGNNYPQDTPNKGF
ncbi:hypothetical protein NCCP133_23820 [Cytobacillus sp. NCCP-133]|nr:hypothetical protein NCCP133_23820 [Cytobacillus sp. NCCP-133]